MSQYKLFAQFMGFNYKRPKPLDICAYIEYMVEKTFSPGTIRNNISHIKTYMRLRSRSTKSLRSLKVAIALRAVDIHIRHVPQQRPPVTPEVLRGVIRVIRQRTNGPMMCLDLILMYEGFLRQSNVLPPSVKKFDPTRHMTVADVQCNDTHLVVKIKWSKTHQTLGDSQVVNLYKIPGSLLCPVAAFVSAYQHQKGHTSTSPLIAFRDGNPITLGYMKRHFESALSVMDIPPTEFSLHSLRRGGASYTYYKGADMHDVMRHGGWRSESVRAYLRPPPNFTDTVHRALQQL